MAASVQCALAYSFSQMTISHLSARGNVCFSEPSTLFICPFPEVHRLAFLAVTSRSLEIITDQVSCFSQQTEMEQTENQWLLWGPSEGWNLEVQINSERDSQDQPTWAGTRIHSLRVRVSWESPLYLYFTFTNLVKLLHRYERNPKLLGSRQVKEEPLK